MMKYKTVSYGALHADIKTIEIDKETEQSVWIKGRRRAKISESECFFDTWLAAHRHILNRAQKLVELARLRFDKYKGLLVDIKEMKEDEL